LNKKEKKRKKSENVYHRPAGGGSRNFNQGKFFCLDWVRLGLGLGLGLG
jgi:hypothetical protein